MNEQKTLKFDANLVPLILSSEKTTTWRLFDDKNLQTGDIIELIKRPELTVFAKAKIVEVIEKPLGALTQEEMTDHGKFASEAEMYEYFTNCYKTPVNKNTLVKIIKFELIK